MLNLSYSLFIYFFLTQRIKERTKYDKLKSLFLENISISSVHGLPNLFRSNRICLKALWAIAFVVSTIGCIWMIVNIFIDYNSNQVVTNIFVKHEPKLVLPAVTICNFFEGSQYPDEYITELRLEYNEINLNSICYRFNISSPKNGGFFKCSKLNGGRNSSGDLVPLLSLSNVGKDEGLAIYLTSKGLTFPSSEKIFQYFIADNYIHPSGIEINTFVLSNNYQANIAVSKTVSKKMEFPYNDCYMNVAEAAGDKSLINKISESNTTYLQVNCLDMCQEDYVSRKCNCTFYGFLRSEESYETAKDCNKDPKNLCVNQELLSFNKREICGNKCPLECDSVDFAYSIQSYALEKNKIKIKVFYNSLRYTEISQFEKTTATDVVANFGGTLG